MKNILATDSALKRLLFRTLWTFVSVFTTAVLVYFTDNYSNAAWYPLIQYAINTVKDIANRNLPNVPEGK